jgi:hypothetical protein
MQFEDAVLRSSLKAGSEAGTRGEGRTLNLRLRRPTLYPIELLAQPTMNQCIGSQLTYRQKSTCNPMIQAWA